MEQNKTLTSIGLCKRAGKLLIGSENTEHSVRRGKSKLVIVASDVSENTRDKYERLSEETEKTIIIFTDIKMTELASAVGQSGILGVVSTEDAGFAKMLSAKLLKDSNNGGKNHAG